MVYGKGIKMKLIQSCESHTPLPSWCAFPKNGLTTPIRHAFSTCRITVKPNKSYSMRACMCMLGSVKAEESMTLNATVMSLHNLLTSHPHPSVTHGEQIRWTASITWHYTLLLQAFFQGNKIWSTSFHSTVCMCECCCQFGRRCFSTECSCGHSRDLYQCAKGMHYGESCDPWKVTLGTQAPAGGKSPLQFATWHNQPHLHTNTEIKPNT